MELKNAVAVCLISLFSATLVVLIARSLDLQTASRLEPQLTRIAEELQAIHTQGGIALAVGDAAASQAADDALMVYYFHGDRCATCRAAESNARETLEVEYASQLAKGEVVWKVLDYMTDATAISMAKDFNVTASTIVLVKMKAGEIEVWNRLDRILALATDKPTLSAYLQSEINEMLGTHDQEPESTQPDVAPAIPVPDSATGAVPLPTSQVSVRKNLSKV